jgi:LuxR family maltose regulon positive regulatory protein
MVGKYVAKITRPSSKRIFPRKRLFRLVDSGRDRPILWVFGPPGCGKTALVASYLDARKLPSLWYRIDEGDADIATFFYYTSLAAKKATPRKRKSLPYFSPEYEKGIPIFTRRYFEDLFSLFSPPFALVLDNYQDIANGSRFHEMISCGLDMIPAGINVIALSRNEPPSPFARLRASSMIYFLEWPEIRFTLEELREVVRAKWHRQMDDESLRYLYQMTEGWAAGIILMTESPKIDEMPAPLSGGFPVRKIIDYFASEIFEKMEGETRDFLLKTAFLPRITPQAAKRLTDLPIPDKILADLSEKHFFTEKDFSNEPTYQYHPMFRKFLLSRAKDSLGHEEIARLRLAAALLLEESGQIEDAARLLLEAKNWDRLVQLIIGQAQPLIDQGRQKTLAWWIENLPPELVENTPWLQYWQGICVQPFSPANSLIFFEKAFHSFQTGGEIAGTFLSWAGSVDSIIYALNDWRQLDRWIDWLLGRIRRDPVFPSLQIEASVASSFAGALLHRRPKHPALRRWLERALSLTKEIGDINLRMQANLYAAIYYHWIGDISHCRMIAEEMEGIVKTPSASPLLIILWKWIEALLATFSLADHDHSLRAVQTAVEKARASGVYVWNAMLYAQGAFSSLSKEDTEQGRRFLREMESTLGEGARFVVCHYHYLAAWHFLLLGELALAMAHGKRALQNAVEIGWPFLEISCHLEMACLLKETGELQKAVTHLALADKLIRPIGSLILEYMWLLADAWFSLDQGKDSVGLESLRKAMALGRKQGYISMCYWWHPSVMARLCARALAEGIEEAYVQNLIRKRNLFPDKSSLAIENWPWPMKIYTLGQFALVRQDNPIRFSRKAKHKPLLLLKALLAMGGREVKEDQLSDLIWPDAEGDAAHRAFTTTLSRLRRLLAVEKAIMVQDKKVTIDPRSCWVDAWAFENILEQVEGSFKDRQPSPGLEKYLGLVEKAISIYKGHFLHTDEDYAWTASYRERLRSRFHRLITGVGDWLQQKKEWDRAAEYYLKALEVDDLSEEFYQNLMICYHRLGKKAEAISLYQRCRKTLWSVLGIEPSRKTEEIYQALFPR